MSKKDKESGLEYFLERTKIKKYWKTYDKEWRIRVYNEFLKRWCAKDFIISFDNFDKTLSE